MYEHSHHLSTLLEALADESRLRILELLATRAPEEPLHLTLIAHLTQITQAMAGHHLKLLEAKGLVDRVKRGKYSTFTLNREKVSALTNTLLVILKGLRNESI